MGRKRGAGGKDIVLGAKPEWSEVEWRTGGGGTEEGSEKESGIRVRGRHGPEILRKDRKKKVGGNVEEEGSVERLSNGLCLMSGSWEQKAMTVEGRDG